ncbi:MAG: Stk1 family PASTA domain-containing Ser/Thr kinase [Micrococcales bacterium]
MSNLVGQLIHGRYLIEKLVARGGMATVYLAEDNRLDRKVALKVIHPHLANDAEFRSKFVREAKIAAKLSHPNLVNVFDQAEDGEIVFLAMEYVPGITLRDALRDFGALSTNRVLEIFEPILAGLAAAHRAGILHRDIKPENVLLSDDGKIKLSDFGLARAISAHTQTGAVIGTVAYLSPELVSKGIADARSDVYAAGIMLFELLTGQQPYQGEQAVQIAMQHANSEVPAPSTLNPQVPELLDELVLWATAKDPSHRPADAEEFHSVLVRARTDLRQGRKNSFLTEKLELNRTVALPADSFANPARKSNADTEVIDGLSRTVALSDLKSEPTQNQLGSRNRALKILVSGVLAVLLGLGAGWWFSAGPGGIQIMPDLSNRSESQAIKILEGFKADVEILRQSSKTVPAGTVITSDPSSGSIFWGGKIRLLISTGPKLIAVPDLGGKTLVEATALLLQSGFSVGKVSSWFSDSPIGTVFAFNGSDGSLIPEESAVDLEVSLGSIPVVANLDKDVATNLIEVAGLKVKEVSEEYSDSVAKGKVISLIPLSNPIGKSGEVNLVISKGTNVVVMPKVIGETISAAKSLLESLQLRVLVDTNQLTSKWGIAKIKKSSVAQGTKLRIGDTVTIISR